MRFAQAVKTCFFRKYFAFSGRASRSEFWWFSLFCWLALIVGAILSAIVLSILVIGYVIHPYAAFLLFGILVPLILVSLLIPSLAVTVRRLHDMGWSGWWCLLCIAPGVGIILDVRFGGYDFNGYDFDGYISSNYIPNIGMGLSLVLMVVEMIVLARAGEPGANRFGANPLGPDTSSDVFA